MQGQRAQQTGDNESDCGRLGHPDRVLIKDGFIELIRGAVGPGIGPGKTSINIIDSTLNRPWKHQVAISGLTGAGTRAVKVEIES